MHTFIDQLFDLREDGHWASALHSLRAFGGTATLMAELQQQRQLGWVDERAYHYLLEQVLLYVVSLSLLSKLFLLQQGKMSEIDISSQVSALILLVLVISLGRKTTPRSSISAQFSGEVGRDWTVLRGSEVITINQVSIITGDLLLLKPSQTIPVDGVLLQIPLQPTNCNRIIVSQVSPNSEQVQIVKLCIEEIEEGEGEGQDPFISRGTQVVSGEAWLLVCRTNQKFRSEEQGIDNNNGQLGQLRTAVDTIRFILLLPILLSAFWWLALSKNVSSEGFVDFVVGLGNILIYLNFLSQDSSLWMLSQQFGQSQSTIDFSKPLGKVYEEISRHDIIILLEQGRENLQTLSLLNLTRDIKIVTVRSRAEVEKDFAQQINRQVIYNKEENMPLRSKVPALLAAKYISTHLEQLHLNYTSLLEELGYSLLILSIDSSDHRTLIESQQGEVRTQLGKVKHSFSKGDALMRLQFASSRLQKLKDCYLAIVVNNCLQFVTLVGCACCGLTLNLNLGLLLLQLSRSSLPKLLKRWMLQEQSLMSRSCNWLTFNLLCLVYYAFVLLWLVDCQEPWLLLFLLLLVGRLFRIEALMPVAKAPFCLFNLGILGLVVGLLACVHWLENQLVPYKWTAIAAFPLITCTFNRFEVQTQ